MTDEKLKALETSRAKAWNETRKYHKIVNQNQIALDKAKADFIQAKQTYESLDRAIAEEKHRRKQEVEEAKKASNAKKSNTTTTIWKKVFAAIKDLPEEQKLAILANLEKEI